MFRKPISELTAADIDQICKDRVRESDIVEFKQGLSAKRGLDGWHLGADSFGEVARDKIVHEIIAFANAHGGTLILGIEETADKPARAEKIQPIVRCADLAGRLSQTLADLADPPLAPFPVIVPVPTDGDRGIVVFQIAPSLNAPHRHRTNLKSHVRRGEQAVPMTMREIQDLTMRIERGHALLERQFTESAERFSNGRRSSTGLALRATAVPLSPLSVAIPADKAISPTFQRFRGEKGGRPVEVVIPRAPVNFRPILRGIRATESHPQGSVTAELKANGFLELFFYVRDRDELAFPSSWFVALACNALIFADTLRNAAASPGSEYGLELEAYATPSLSVHEIGGGEFIGEKWDGTRIIFPRYHVGERASFPQVMKLVDFDFWSALGRSNNPDLQMEFESG